MQKMFHFLQYHNAVPIALGILVLGAGATFAASDPQAIYSQTQTVLTEDNTYIAAKDLSAYSPQAQITFVTEDDTNYYVAYDYNTIDVDNYVWKDVVKHNTITAPKDLLQKHDEDLGVYVTGIFRGIIDHDMDRLAQEQTIARRETTQKTVAVAYGGLVGKFLNDSTETLPGYTPVVQGPPEAAAAAAASGGGTSGSSSGGSSSQVSLQVVGNNPARIPLRSSYVDLGVALIDPHHTNVGVHTFLNGSEVISPTIDTSTTTSYAIEYRVTDLAGNSLVTRRIVLVGDAPDPGGEINSAGNVSAASVSQSDTSSSSATTTPNASSTPASIATSTDSSSSATSTPDTTATSTPDQTATSSSPDQSASTTDATSPAGSGASTTP